MRDTEKWQIQVDEKKLLESLDQAQRADSADHARRVEKHYTAGVSGESYDELEHLKQQYVDGDLTEEEFERRLEELDDLSPAPEPDQREIDAIRQNLIRGFVVGGFLAVGAATLAVITAVSAQLGLFLLALIISLTVWVMER